MEEATEDVPAFSRLWHECINSIDAGFCTNHDLEVVSRASQAAVFRWLQ